ncbi:amidase [Lutibaculum baratangense]|uniref:Aspartyl-tRNA(Asn) amidotransferase subunit A n=1 Tax=Lutibaculum baratangense AMV1 TaxID=631454 RepID=V4RGS3_9HYPH|nr:amidase [Lutibaculum baratangense]ESR25356.1 Aspartyl-tRNA(Asn) amidotransferase subunit A [Lutibaculum baratangense AMV1]
MSDIHALSLTELASRLRDGRLGAVEVTEAFLRRIEALNPRLHAFLDPGAERALSEAARRDEVRAKGGPLGPLHGVPVAIKDIIDVEGTPTTANSRVTVTECAAEDAFVVARLRRAGAVILGKTALHEFATGGPSFDLPWPPARNPWNQDHHPAGSSSGSGAAVAAGLAPAALGTDTAGSVRHPGTACGIVGMKPTYGAISRRGVFPLAQSLDYVGPMTRGVADNALLFDACVGHDGRDPTSARDARPVGPIDGGIEGMRIGVIEEFGREARDEIAAAFTESCETLRRLGARLVPVEIPPLEDFADCGRLIIQAESFAIHKKWLQERYHDYGWRARTKILSGAFVDAATYLQAQKLRRVLCEELARAMRGLDAVVCVSSLEHPARIDDDEAVDATYDRQARTPFNLTGQPAISVPAGLSADGLPLGMQIVGRPFDELTVYRVAMALERERPWAHLWPPLAAPEASPAG